MTREENYKRGAKAEERIMEYIQKHGAIAERTNARYPDLLMKIDGHSYGVECKSLAAVNNGNGGRKGNAIISSQEMAGMNALVEQDLIPCMVVEIRPPSGPASKSYFFIDWSLVNQKYGERRPVYIALTFYWILQHGQHLGYWLVGKTQEGIQ